MLPSNRSVPKAGVFFQLELFQISSTFLTFYYFLLFQQMTDLKERNLDSTNLLNLPESTPGLSSLVSFHQHPQKLYSPLSFVSRPLASFLTTIPFESYSPAALDFLHLEMCACASGFPALLLHGMNYLSLKSQIWPPT